jgi:ribosomal subunit interface protein
MRVRIQAREFTLTDALREHVERRIRFALTRFGPRLLQVSVRLEDVNGPRGGEDKRCTVQVSVTRQPQVVVEETAADMYEAIDRAAARTERTVERKLARERTLEGAAAARGLG